MVRFDSIRRMAPIILMVGLLLPMLIGNGCPTSDDTTGTGSKATPIASIQVSGTARTGETITLIGSGSGGQGNYVYTWAPDESIDSSEIEGSLHATEIRFTPSKAGGYRFTFAVTDAGGLGRTGTASVTVVVFAQVAVKVSSNYLVTLGTPVTFQATPSGGDGNYTISWTLVRVPDSADYTFTGSDTFTPTFKPMTRGRYFFEVVVKDGGGKGQEGRAETVAVTPGNAGLISLTWEPNYVAGGYQMVAVFDEQLDKSTAELADNYRVSGTDALPTSAVLSSNLQTVTLIFNTPMGRSSLVDLSLDGGILDTTGAPVAPIQNRAVAANSRDILVPEIASATWQINQLDQYRYDVIYSEAMDRESVEIPSLYRTTRSDTWAASATLGNDGRTVTVAFNKIALSTGTEFDVGVTGEIKDINGRVMPAFPKLTAKPNTGDKTAPKVVAGSIMHAPDFSGGYSGANLVGGVIVYFYGGGYKIIVRFNEVMSAADVESTAGWQVNGNTPSWVTLSNDGKTVELLFSSPLSIVDRMDVGLLGTLRDINQNPVTVVSSQVILPSPEDRNRPRVIFPTPRWSSNWGGGGYRVELDFSEAMDNESVSELSNYQLMGWSIPEPSMVSLNTAGLSINAAATAYLTWYLPLYYLEYLDISLGDSLKDINGRTMAERKNVLIEQNQNDTAGPYITSLLWAINRPYYTIIVKFDEAMDSGTTWSPSNYLVTQAGNEDDLVSPAIANPANDGLTVTLTFNSRQRGFQSGGTLDDDNPPDQLFIADAEYNGTILVRGLQDVNRQAYPWAELKEDQIITIIGQNPADTQRPYVVSSVIYDPYGPIEIEFNEVLNLRTITPGSVSITDASGASLCPPDADGNRVSIVDNVRLLIDGRTVEVTLKASTENGACRGVATGDKLIINGIQDINGRSMISTTITVD